jgi:hypothetical protein
MPASIDWDYWRKTYIQGDDRMDLKVLSKYADAPAYQTLRNRSSKENWPEQRKRYQENVSTLASTIPEVKATAQQVQKIIDSAEMLTRHSKLARSLGSIAARAFASYNPEELRPSDALNMAKLAIEVERITEGMATQRQEIDLKGLSDAELERLANGGS